MKIPDHYKLIKEHPTHFEIHDARVGKMFPVAKHTLDPALHAQISQIPKFSQGGLQQEGLETQALPPATGPWSGFGNTLSGIANIGSRMPAPEPAIPPPETPSVPAGPQAIDPSQISFGNMDQSVGAQTPSDPMKEFDAAIAQGRAGISQQSQAEQAEAGANEKTYDTLGQNLQASGDQFANDMGKYKDRSESLFNQYVEGKVDPEKYWDNHSRLAAGIGVVLSGIGAGLGHSDQNLALNMINKEIDRSIGAQEFNLNKLGKAHQMNQEEMNDLRKDYAEKRADYLTMAAAETKKAAAKAGTPLARAKEQWLGMHLGVQAAQQHLAAAGHGLEKQALTTGISSEDEWRLSPESRKLAVRLPDGSIGLARDSKGKEEYDKMQAAYSPLMEDLKKLKGLMTVKGKLLDRGAIKALTGQAVQEIMHLHNFNRLTHEDVNLQKSDMGDPDKIAGVLYGPQAIDALMGSIDREVLSTGQQYIPTISNRLNIKNKSQSKLKGLEKK